MRVKMAMLGVAALGLLGAAPAQPPAAPTPLTGYLAGNPIDTYKILPPAPVAGTTRYEADRTIFLQTRKLQDSARWKLAQNDDNSAAIMKDLACAVGVEITAKNAPTLASMIPRIGRDASRLTNLPKDIYKRDRPFRVDEGPVCIAKPDSYDYPSGHNTWGWTMGLIMAELAPDRATEILIRAKAFGESRLVCGVHNLSAVEAGRTNGSIVVAALHGDEAFRKDLEVARKEVAAARKAGPAPDPATCAAEAELTAKSPY
jgi:acid phosphatase (class A)